MILITLIKYLLVINITTNNNCRGNIPIKLVIKLLTRSKKKKKKKILKCK